MRFTVGGRSLELTRQNVEQRMSQVEPEPIREHLVEVDGRVFPPKQVLAVVTDWDRTSYTTMEAQRVLAKLGFPCRRAGQPPEGEKAWVRVESPKTDATRSTEERLAAVEAALSTAQAAIAGLHARVQALETAAR